MTERHNIRVAERVGTPSPSEVSAVVTSVPAVKLRRHRFWLAAGLLLLLAVAGAAGGWLWHRQRPPAAALPALDLTGSDPEVIRAVEKHRQRVLQEPDSAAAWGHLGEILDVFNLRPEALTCLAQAEQLNPNEPRWPYHQGILLLYIDPNDAVPKLRRAAELCGDSNLAPRVRLSETLLSLNQVEEAEEGFRHVRQREPSNARALLGLGRIALKRHQWPQAQMLLEVAATDLHSERDATLALAELHRQKGDRETAAQLYQRVERLPKDQRWHDPFLEELHRHYIGKRNRILEANRFFEQGRLAEMIERLTKITADYPDSPDGWFALGQALHWKGAYAEAEHAMQKAVDLAPKYAEAYNYLGAAQFRQGKHADAEPALRKAIELKPDFALAYVNLGRCLHQQKEYAKAIEEYRNAVRCKPDYAPAHTELAEVLHQTNQDAEALDAVRQALQLDPDNKQAQQLRKQLEASK